VQRGNACNPIERDPNARASLLLDLRVEQGQCKNRQVRSTTQGLLIARKNAFRRFWLKNGASNKKTHHFTDVGTGLTTSLSNLINQPYTATQ
jgi:hypothetical protein